MKRLIPLVLTVLPLLAPIPAAWVVFGATMRGLGWPWYVAGVAAVSIEGLGFASVNLTERMWAHNRSLRLDERSQKWAAPTWQPAAAAALYLVVTTSAILFLGSSQLVERLLPAMFPLLGVLGAALWAIHAEQQSREAQVAAWRSQRDAQRRQRRSSDAAPVASDARRRSRVAQRRSPATLYRCECGATFTNRFQYSGHAGRCALHQGARSRVIPIEELAHKEVAE